MQVGDDLHNYAANKVEHLGRYFDGIISVDVVLASEKNREVCELVAHLVRKKIAKASAEADDMHAAIDAASDKLKKQLRRYKGRIKEKTKQNRAPASPQASPQREATAADRSGESAPIHHSQVFLRKPMTREEAVLQLESQETRDFLIFIDAERGGLSVLHRYPDGGYEVIEPVY